MIGRGRGRRRAPFLSSSGPALLALALLAPGPAGAEDAFRVSGTVRSSSGVPLEGAVVAADDGGPSTTTDAAGAFALRLLPGEHTLRASLAGYEPEERPVRITGDWDGLDLRLQAVYRVSEDVVVQAVRADARTPVTKTDVDRAEIDRLYHGQEMPALLEGTPGVTQYSDTGSGAGYNYLYLRGIQQTRLNVTLDGVPLSEPEDSALYFVDFGDFASNVDSVQIQRGVGTSTVGAASLGGSINFASVDLTEAPRLLGTAGVGSFGSARGSLAFQSGRVGPGLAFYGRGSYQQTDGFREHSGVVQRSLSYGATRQGKRSFLKVFGFTGRERTQEAFLAVDEPTLEQDLRTNPLDPAERDRFGQDFVQAQLTRALGSSSSVSLQGYYNGAGGWYRLWDSPEHLALQQYELDWHFFGGLVTYRHAGARLHLTTGVHVNAFTSEHGQRDTGSALRNYTNHGHRNEASGFAKLAFDLGPWHLYGDAQLRWARFRHEGSLDLGSVDWTFFNPKLGVRRALGAALSLYASVGRTTREPTRSDLFAGEDDPRLPYDLSAVRPERVTDFEGGLDYRTEALTLQVDLYAMEFTNEIALTGELSEIGLPLRRNVDRSHRRGLEVDARWRASSALRLTGSANLSRNRIRTWTQFYDVYDPGGIYLQSEARVHHDVPPLLTPAVVANLGADWTPWRELTVSARGRYVGRSYLDNTNDPEATTPSWLALDASAVLDLGRKLPRGHPRLRLEVKNLLDDRRLFASGYSYLYLTREAGAAPSLTAIPYYYPLATRSLYAGLDLEW
jgi:iron complex outermembrane recepter protein